VVAFLDRAGQDGGGPELDGVGPELNGGTGGRAEVKRRCGVNPE
jgi:hypothetical protein